MKEPTRWFDDPSLSPEHRRLLLAATPPPPLPLQQHEFFASLTTKLAAEGALGKLAAASLLTKLVVLSATMGVAMFAGYLVTQSRPPTVSVQPKPMAQSPIQTPAELVTTNQQPQIVASSPGGNLIPESDSNNVRVAATTASASRDVPATSRHRETNIRDEAALLERARRALSASAANALALTDEHRERFGAGQLAAERELIAVQALVNLGRKPQAEQRAKRFFVAYTSSVYQRRMRKVLGLSEEFTLPTNP